MSTIIPCKNRNAALDLLASFYMYTDLSAKIFGNPEDGFCVQVSEKKA